jgi:hypothetical protein
MIESRDVTTFADTGCEGWPTFRGTYLDFGPLPKDGKRTWKWQVFSIDRLSFLGNVVWFGRWRKYAFFPEPGCVFDDGCLHEIADFTKLRTAEHREGKKL